MPSTFLFLVATLLLSLNFIRPLGLAVSDWLYFGALGFGLLETFSLERRHAACWWRNKFLWAVVLILFGAIVSTMNSENWVVALVEIFQQIFVMTLFTSLIWIMVRRGKTDRIVLAFILSGVFAAGVAGVDYLTGSRLGPSLSGTPEIQLWGRFAGSLGHPNKLGYFLVLTTLLSLGRLPDLKPARGAVLSHLIWYLLIAIQLFGIYLSGSLTAFLGLLAGVVILIFSSRAVFDRMKRSFWVITGGTVLALVVVLTANAVPAQGFANTTVYQAINRVQSSTAASRLEVYVQAWDQIIQNPWFGVGYDQISTSGVSAASRYLDFSVHNTLLQIWYTGGLFAFIGWLSVYIAIAWMALGILRSKHYALSPLILSLAAAALAVLLMDQFQDAIYQREKWLVIGLLAGVAWTRTRAERALDAEKDIAR
jgi:O-antigen ligase